MLGAVVRYYGFGVGEAMIARAGELARFDNMQHIEASGAFAEPWLRPRNGWPKVRRGKVGAFRDELGGTDIDYLNRLFFSESLDQD
jgi:hypothetical protein